MQESHSNTCSFNPQPTTCQALYFYMLGIRGVTNQKHPCSQHLESNEEGRAGARDPRVLWGEKILCFFDSHHKVEVKGRISPVTGRGEERVPVHTNSLCIWVLKSIFVPPEPSTRQILNQCRWKKCASSQWNQKIFLKKATLATETKENRKGRTTGSERCYL